MLFPTIRRKARIAWLCIKIAALRFSMAHEDGPTDLWKRMARRQAEIIRERNALLTDSEVRRIEKRRGLL